MGWSGIEQNIKQEYQKVDVDETRMIDPNKMEVESNMYGNAKNGSQHSLAEN